MSQAEEQIASLRRRRDAVSDQLLVLKTELDNGDFSKLDEIELTIKLDVLERIYKNFESAQLNLAEADTTQQTSGAYSDFTSNFMKIKAALSRCLKQVVQSTQTGVQSSTFRADHGDESRPTFFVSSKPRLPVLKIPVFSGKCTEWPDFFSLFNSIVGSDVELTKIEKFQHLRSCLVGSALDAVRSLEINDANYDKAIELLEKRFDNKRLNFQAHIRAIFDLDTVSSSYSLRQLADKLTSHFRALQTMGTKTQLADCLLIHIVSQKLDVESNTKWEETTPIDHIPTWDSMIAFLDRRCQMLETVQSVMVKNNTSQVSKKFNNNRSKALVAAVTNKCAYCLSSEHSISKCEKFLGFAPEQRFKEVKRLNLCINCLKGGHSVKYCKSSTCRHCLSKHNSLLHITNWSDQANNFTPASGKIVHSFSQSPEAAISSSQISSNQKPQQQALVVSAPIETKSETFVFLATAVVLVDNNAGTQISCRAILDSASQLNFISNRFANQLQVKCTKATTIISGIGESELVSNQIVDINIHSRVGSYQTTLSAVVVPNIVDNQPSYDLNNISCDIPDNLQLADPLFFKSQRVDLLIGAGLFFDLMCIGQIRISPELPMLQKTRLGWIVAGPSKILAENRSCIIAAENYPVNSPESSLEKLIKCFWEIENHCEPTNKLTKEELDCENHFVNNFERLASGYYAVRLPLKENPAVLGDSYTQALRRFRRLEHRLQQNQTLLMQYSSFMLEYSALGHMSEIESINPDIHAYFLPHHCVFKEDSTTTKLRVVFDGSARTSSGVSLNDVLMAGPTIQQSLFFILLRFRSFQIALTGDICKMYRCVRVSYPDNYLQCILWRDNPNQHIRMFSLDTVTYGTKSASFLAIRSLQQLAIDEAESFPIGSKITCRDFYVDDLISGGNSREETKEILKQTTSLLAKGGFKLRKCCSNDREILDGIADEDKEQLLKFHDGTDIIKTLGLVWDPKSDQFIFSFNPAPMSQKHTKRTVLSFIARMYDPLGLIGPSIAKAKIFLQNLWKEKLDWDESLPQALHTCWKSILLGFEVINKCSFPRLVLLADATAEIHAFCDASQLAYGACIYILSKQNGIVTSHLLCSKSRVAPLKVLTIPKLELSAALLLAELLSSLSQQNIFNYPIYCWSDSTVALSWIQDESSNYNTFVSNRISRIQALTENMSWHYVPSELNPADTLSRGALPQDLCTSSLWRHGPPFLKLEKSEWPRHPITQVNLPERRGKVLVASTKFEDYSIACKYANSFGKMQRIYAYIYRFGAARGESRRAGPLSINDIQRGTFILLRMIQRIYFPSEYSALSAEKTIDHSSKLVSLNPFIDDYGVLRVGGRLQNSELSFESKHPIILPKGHIISSSIISYFHEKLLHSGPQSLCASLRLQYWHIGGKKEVSRVVNKCIRCFRMRPKVMQHIMGNLPAERVQPSRVFHTTGVDFCGPFFYKSELRSKGPVKCYICLFICFATKAVHLELVKDLSTSSFLAGLKRFFSIRGKPRTIWSDNATNFVGAKNELKELKQLFVNQNHISEVYQQCLEDGVDWRFIPPRSPHFGGLWEAAIKTSKFHLRRVVGLSILDFEELRTLICVVSAILNSRPLCALSDTPDDLSILTPAHFLIGCSFMAPPEPDVSNLNLHRLGRWQKVCYMQQIFWAKWSTEYLTILQQRTKWRTASPNIQIGALVLLKDEITPPLKWPLGRVIELLPGKDGTARVAVIRVANGEIRRAVSKLCPLPSNDMSVEG